MEELRKNRDDMKYRLADAMKLCMCTSGEDYGGRDRRSLWDDAPDVLSSF